MDRRLDVLDHALRLHVGQYIGQLERTLIFLFVLIGQPTGVGFLVAAKSVFRFGDLKEHEDRMEAEYITRLVPHHRRVRWFPV